LGRAGSKHWLSKCPIVRGVVINLVDNPHRGVEGRALNCIKNLQPCGVFLHLEEEVEKKINIVIILFFVIIVNRRENRICFFIFF